MRDQITAKCDGTQWLRFLLIQWLMNIWEHASFLSYPSSCMQRCSMSIKLSSTINFSSSVLLLYVCVQAPGQAVCIVRYRTELARFYESIPVRQDTSCSLYRA